MGKLLAPVLASLAGLGWGMWLAAWWRIETRRRLKMVVPRQVVRILVGFQSLLFGTAIWVAVTGPGAVAVGPFAAWGIPALVMLDAAIWLTLVRGIREAP